MTLYPHNETLLPHGNLTLLKSFSVDFLNVNFAQKWLKKPLNTFTMKLLSKARNPQPPI